MMVAIAPAAPRKRPYPRSSPQPNDGERRVRREIAASPLRTPKTPLERCRQQDFLYKPRKEENPRANFGKRLLGRRGGTVIDATRLPSLVKPAVSRSPLQGEKGLDTGGRASTTCTFPHRPFCEEQFWRESKEKLDQKIANARGGSGVTLKLWHWNSYQPERGGNRQRCCARELLQQVHELQGTLQELAVELEKMVRKDDETVGEITPWGFEHA